MRELKNPEALISSVFAAAKRLNPDAQVLVKLGSTSAGNLRFARGEVTSTGDADDETVSVTIQVGKRRAVGTANQVDAATVRDTVERAYRLAKISPEDPEVMPVLGPQKYLTAPSAFDPASDRLSAEHRASAVESALGVAKSAGEDLDLAGYFERQSLAQTIATSAGARAGHRLTRVRLSTTARTSDGTGSGWAAAHSQRASEVKPAELARRAVDKATRSRKPRPLAPGRYTVVLEPAAVAEMLNALSFQLPARLADEGRSFFAAPGGGTRVGEKLFSEKITLRSDPADAAAPSAPFDDEGMPLKPTTWIESGKLLALSYTRFWAQKMGKAPTGQHASWQLGAGDASLEALISGVKRGLLVTRFWYTRTLDPQTLLLTGLTRDGLFLIENGQVVAPVNNFRYNESVAQMLKNVDAVGSERVRLPAWPGILVPALRSREFNFASVSEAV
jgi:predicted Zn-dependent protease